MTSGAALLALLVACGSRESAPSRPAVTTAPPTSAPREPDPATTPLAPPAVVPTNGVAGARSPAPRMRTTPEQRAARRDALAAARAAVAADRWAAAVDAFERALAVDPADARLRCETGYAAYRAGDTTRAERWITEAVRALPDPAATPESMRIPVAMCLYNAGLVHEARGRWDDARAAYAASLRLRPNETVQQHLDALGGARSGPDGVLVLDGLDDAAIDARILAIECDDEDASHCTPGHHEVEDDDYDLTQEPGALAMDAPTPPPFVARTVWFGRSSASEGNQGVLTHHGWLVVHDETHALAARVAAEDATQTWDCDGGARIERFAWSDVLPGDAPELVVEATSCGGEMTMCDDLSRDARRIVVCAASPLRCIEVTTRQESSGSVYPDCDENEAEPYREGFRLDAELANGTLTLRPTFGNAPIPALVGTHPIAELFERGDLLWASR